MSLSKPTTTSVIKKQFHYKKEAYLDQFLTLIILQVLALAFSFGGTGTMGSGRTLVDLHVTFYSADVVIMFTMLWGFITAISLTTKSFRYDDFSFVTNRVSSNVSNVLFLLAASIFAGTTAMFSSFLQKVLLHYFGQKSLVVDNLYANYYQEFWIGVGASILHVLFICAIGYLIGSLVQLSKLFIVIIPAAFFLFIRSASSANGIGRVLYEFYYQEPSFIFFTIKVLITTVALFIGATAITNRLEVRV